MRLITAHLPKRLASGGGSVGGHLSAMAGLTNSNPAFEFGENSEQSSQVDAVVDMFGPTDLTQSLSWLQRWFLSRAFGTDSPGDAQLITASPAQ